MLTRCFLPALLCLSPAVCLHAQDPAALLEKSRQLTTLEQPSGPSFHLRAEFHTFDYKGVPDGDGTVEETFEHGGRWKRTTVYRGQQKVEVFPGSGKPLVQAAPDYERSFAEEGILKLLFAPVPSAETMKGMKLSIAPYKLGPLDLTCVVASLPYQSEGDSKATAPNEAYCLAPEIGFVRSVQGHTRRVAIFNSLVKIGTTYFAKDIVISERGKPRANLHVTALEPSPAFAPDEFTLPGATGQQADAPEIPHTVIAGRVLRKLDPIYPESARQRHVQGQVVLHAMISTQGTIRDLELVSTPDDSLAESAMDAVRKWTYQPYLLDGKPVAIDSQIRVNYAFGPSR